MPARRRPPPAASHHPALRQALIAQALRIVEERGPGALTLREAARRAGVSHAAPAHHFVDLAGLREAAAAAGHDALRAALLAGTAGARGGVARLRAAAAAYVQFAAERPALFGLMFEGAGGRRAGAPELERAAAAAYEVVLGAIRAAQEEGAAGAGGTREQALTAWAAVHGLAALAAGGLAARKGFLEPPRRLAELVVHALGEGLRPR